jgi:hypothetical protein
MVTKTKGHKMRKALVVSTAGIITEVDLDNDSLKTLQTAVGGWIQAVDLNPTITVWMNEEGKFNGMELNPYATLIWGAAFGHGTDVIMGTAVFTGGTDENGETLAIGEIEEKAVREMVSLGHLANVL